MDQHSDTEQRAGEEQHFKLCDGSTTALPFPDLRGDRNELKLVHMRRNGLDTVTCTLLSSWNRPASHGTLQRFLPSAITTLWRVWPKPVKTAQMGATQSRALAQRAAAANDVARLQEVSHEMLSVCRWLRRLVF